MDKFKLISDYQPKGDQPEAIRQIVDNLGKSVKHQVLLGVTGSGKTFTMANVISAINRPTLVIVHNKTLAAQLYSEFKELFPENAVEYFVSYYDYFQPEAYIPKKDVYIEKDSSINEEIDKMRHSATRSLFSRKDVIIIASVSCIYGLGSPESYNEMHIYLEENINIEITELLNKLIEIQYERNDIDFHRGTFRVRGDLVEIFPAYEEKLAIRLEFFGDLIEKISVFDPLTGYKIRNIASTNIYPASHYVVEKGKIKIALDKIRAELTKRLTELFSLNKLVEQQRLEQRTNFDLEMLEEIGYCSGIENYSRHFDQRKPGEPPYTLFDYFPKDFLIIIDESHVTVPQIGAMYKGDRSRKMNLVEYGFRLPSALDNRPLTFDEYKTKINQVLFVSATPGDYELQVSEGIIIEQIIRPTGLLDPEIVIRSAKTQVDDLLNEIKKRVEKDERVLVTTLTKRMAEDLTEYYLNAGIRVQYLHSDIATLERIEIIRDLRLKKFDVIIGINLLREGLDIPEVSLVAILDADKEGFLRSQRSLIQTFGRAARNVNGTVILYAEKLTKSMKFAIDETNRRRKIQEKYNIQNNITPASIKKNIGQVLGSVYEKDYINFEKINEKKLEYLKSKDIPKEIEKLKKEMFKMAEALNFEKAATLRDQISILQKELLQYK